MALSIFVNAVSGLAQPYVNYQPALGLCKCLWDTSLLSVNNPANYGIQHSLYWEAFKKTFNDSFTKPIVIKAYPDMSTCQSTYFTIKNFQIIFLDKLPADGSPSYNLLGIGIHEFCANHCQNTDPNNFSGTNHIKAFYQALGSQNPELSLSPSYFSMCTNIMLPPLLLNNNDINIDLYFVPFQNLLRPELISITDINKQLTPNHYQKINLNLHEKQIPENPNSSAPWFIILITGLILAAIGWQIVAAYGLKVAFSMIVVALCTSLGIQTNEQNKSEVKADLDQQPNGSFSGTLIIPASSKHHHKKIEIKIGWDATTNQAIVTKQEE